MLDAEESIQLSNIFFDKNQFCPIHINKMSRRRKRCQSFGNFSRLFRNIFSPGYFNLLSLLALLFLLFLLLVVVLVLKPFTVFGSGNIRKVLFDQIKGPFNVAFGFTPQLTMWIGKLLLSSPHYCIGMFFCFITPLLHYLGRHAVIISGQN